MQTQSLNLFDNEITDLVDMGHNRPAIEHAKEHATHALATATGIYLSRLADVDTAIKLMKLSVEIQPRNPVLYSNLVCLLCKKDQYEEALKYSKVGIELSDAAADMFYNHGIACKCLGMLEEAAKAFRQARDMNPECAITHCQLANILLPLGEYEEGLQEEEWRFKGHSGLQACRRRYKMPDWDGKTDLRNKKILVFNEQGHGDAIHYSRYIPKLKELGAYVIFEIQPELHDLYIKSPFIDELVKREEGTTDPVKPLPAHDFVVSVGSLAYLFDPKLDNIPMTVPYVWPVDANMATVNSLIDYEKGKFKVGIIWAGSQFHTNDKYRSCFLKQFEPITKIPNISLFSLQHGEMERTWTNGQAVLWEGDDMVAVVNLIDGAEQIERTDLAGHIKDFNETALALQKLDLLICVDTSTVHLAGALGLPVWLLLSHAHEWRWRKKWYPTMRIFRQPNSGNWKGLLETVAQELSMCNIRNIRTHSICQAFVNDRMADGRTTSST